MRDLTRIKRWSVVQVSWVDSEQSVSGWVPVTDIPRESVPCVSVGYLVRQTEDYIALSMSYDEQNENIMGWHTIPKVAITGVDVLQLGP